MTKNVLVVRHGQSTWNAEHRWAGHADPPLSPAGRRTADGLARRVAGLGLSGVVASDLRRAHDTAAIVARHCGLEVEVDPRVRERRCGAWSGLTSTEIEAAYPGMLDRWRRGELRELPGDSEPWDDLAERVVAGLGAVAAREGRWLVVSHAGVFRVVEAALGVPSGRVGNLEGRWLEVGAGGLVDGGGF
ncbi:MAG TPA: histidine phosphatase family protein [Acidimicrobiales bacterium]